MSTLAYTSLEDIPEIRLRARRAYASGKTKSVQFRKDQIAQVGHMMKDNEQRFVDAFKLDLGRPEFETRYFDIGGTLIELREVFNNLEQWVKPRKAPFDPVFCVMNPTVKPVPKGTVLILAPFNFPLYLLLGPLMGAIAAGDAAIVKPSEQTPNVAMLFAELFPKYLDPELYQVVNGGIPEATKLLELQWDHIMYTGNSRVGRIVARAAAEHLTPVTLELGGKNPVVIDPNCDLQTAAKRILWGRFSNAGQICVAPEYVLVPAHFQDALLAAFEEVYHGFYPSDPAHSDSFARVVSVAHADHIANTLRETSGTVVLGGTVDAPERYVAPTVVRDVRADDALMDGELFAPVLCVVPVKDVDEALEIINARPNPLVVYVFSLDKRFQEYVFENTHSGSACANECCLTPAVSGIPLGGVGESGHGYATGKYIFEQFSHMRGIHGSPSWLDFGSGLGYRYPPYTGKNWNPMETIAPLPSRPGERWTLWSLSLTGVYVIAGVAVAALGMASWGRRML